MVTFSLPSENELAEAGAATPRPRPPLPFAKRAYVSTPYNAKRLGTPRTSSARKLLVTRDETPSSGLNKSSIATARNIFRASSIGDSPPAAPFSPSLSQSTAKKVFAPGVTPEPTRVFRASTVQATPRGMVAKASSKDLFTMRIEDPDPELSGEVLTQKIPKDWSAKASIYADQYLAHLCPSEFDDEQRRQFFCILDLRRLKYAANDIFVKKDWKLNVINFAKEFEKSRSIILLRYGLYEFHNVKPSKEVLKRWRREHGLPDPDEEAEPSPSRAMSAKKRKAEDDLTKDTPMTDFSGNKNKRRAPETEDVEMAPTATPSFSKNKRKASLGEEVENQPNKLQKSTPSAAKSLFEKIANKTSTAPAGSPTKPAAKPVEDGPATKPNPFATNKANGSLARSVFQNLKPANAQGASGNGNIFGYLSDASSAKNSGVDADGESETDSEPEESQEAGQSDEPSGAETPSQVGSGLFANKPAFPSGFATNAPSAPETRESTPGRSLFDRVTKDSDGQPVRAENKMNGETSAKPAPTDQTWNPTTTPIKFAPPTSSSQPGSIFGNNSTTSNSGIFTPKNVTSNIFGHNQEKPVEKSGLAPAGEDKDKSGYESDKENDSAPKKSVFEPKPSTTQSVFTPSVFQSKPAETASKNVEPAKPATPSFGAPPKTDDNKTSAPAPLFPAKPAEPSPAIQSCYMFKPNTTESDKPATTEPTKSLFGGGAANSTPASTTSNGFFGTKTADTAGNIFGNTSAAPAQQIFGGAPSVSKSDAAPATTSLFNFSGGSSNGDKPNGTASSTLFGQPKSPTANTTGSNQFGSPMKQDNPSPAKKAFTGARSDTESSAPVFGGKFGGGAQSAAQSNIFGNTTASTNGASAPGSIFGGSSASNSGSGGFNFQFGGNSNSSGTSFNNPFTSGNAGDNSGSGSTAPGGIFNFGGSSAQPSNGSTPFQFGAGGNTSTSSAPTFGGSSTTTATSGPPAFNFTAASPAPPQSSSFTFGASQAAPVFGGLQPPAGGASTTGTNSPFSLGGSSLATTPAGGTPEPSAQAGEANGEDNEEGEKHKQINLIDAIDEDEENLHEVRAKVLKFVPAGEKKDEGDEKPKSKSPWSTQGVGPLRLLKHKDTNVVRLLLRAEPRGHVVMNRAVLPDMSYKADEKYVKLTTSNEKGDGLETWMIQVKTKDLAKELAEALEKHKALNKK